MRLLNKRMLLPLAALCALSLSGCKNEESALIGTWKGTLSLGGAIPGVPSGARLRLECDLQKGDHGLTGSIKSVDQGGVQANIDSATVDKGAVRMDVKSLQASYEGKLDANKSEMNGTWHQGGIALPLKLKKAAAS
jgi:hypothetical protein